MYAARVRGRAYAIFGLVILLLSFPGALAMHARIAAWLPPGSVAPAHVAFAYSFLAAGVHLVSLVRARLRSSLFRVLVSIPGMAFIAAGALSGLWLLALLPLRGALHALHFDAAVAALRWLDLVPFAVAAASVVTSLRLPREVVRIQLDDVVYGELVRVPVERHASAAAPPLASRPLRVVQISDPHLGPWQPEGTLRERVAELAAHDPDLVLLTGDFLTMEGVGSPGSLGRALAPLRALAGRCFAIFGNHDHESPEEVRNALAANGVHLLVDEEALVETAAGSVQIVGADSVGRGRKAHLEALMQRFPRRAGALRLLLLHDPLGFPLVPRDDADLVLSGHTHGGQLGLVSLGRSWTVLSRTRWPDHGLFGLGRTRLYVHRGTGFYGFPLRIGVPGEMSVLEIGRA
jgi:predicted MPP superfamily phosphohydrolase